MILINNKTFRNTLNLIFSRRSFEKRLLKEYEEVRLLKEKGESASLFFKLRDREGRQLFAKCMGVASDSLKAEAEAAERLKASEDAELFLLPENSRADDRILIYPYLPLRSLKNVLAERKPDDGELKLLAVFFVKLLAGLRKVHIVHRDITPSNIRVREQNGRISAFLLADFGVAVMDGKIPEGGMRQLHINRTCGSRYRLGERAWDDAHSALLIFDEAAGGDGRRLSAEYEQLLAEQGKYELLWEKCR